MIQDLSKSFLFINSVDIGSVTLELNENISAINKRSDGKLILNFNNEGIINNKFTWYNINYDNSVNTKLPESTIWFANNKYIEKSIEKILTIYYVEYSYQKYIIPFILEELTKFDDEFIKCDIFNTESSNKYYPLEIHNADFIKRHIIKFSPSKKKIKDNINTKYIHKTGNIRLFEYILDFNRKEEQTKVS